jgi:two-component system chemotaxis response regulator CheB
VVALAGTAEEALEALKTIRVDIVLLDVEMPGTTGLAALPEILKRGNGARVMIVSSMADRNAEATVAALALGAADTIPKPGTGNFGGRFAEILADRLRKIGRSDGYVAAAPDAAAPAVPAQPTPKLKLREMPDQKLGCLALGASTGGLYALSEFLKALPPVIGVPILITQHLPGLFVPFFVRQIQTACGRATLLAEEGMTVRPDQIIVAPGDAHIELHRHGANVTIRLGREPAESGCMPSADPMLAAVADAYGASAVAVILSGMGRDGLAGSARIVERGGAVLVQDQQTSAVWGMPRAVAEAGLACAVLSPGDLARRIVDRARGGAWK